MALLRFRTLKGQQAKLRSELERIFLWNVHLMYFHPCSIVWWVIDCNCC